MMLLIEHSVLPLHTAGTDSLHFEAISIVGIFGVELKVLDPKVNDDGCIVHDVMMKVLKILLLVA
jgi:hypothetical protein